MNIIKNKYGLLSCDTIIFTWKDWIIWWCNTGGGDGTESIISHWCLHDNISRCLSSKKIIEDAKCDCGGIIPEEMISVWMLHNFNSIPKYTQEYK